MTGVGYKSNGIETLKRVGLPSSVCTCCTTNCKTTPKLTVKSMNTAKIFGNYFFPPRPTHLQLNTVNQIKPNRTNHLQHSQATVAQMLETLKCSLYSRKAQLKTEMAAENSTSNMRYSLCCPLMVDAEEEVFCCLKSKGHKMS